MNRDVPGESVDRAALKAPLSPTHLLPGKRRACSAAAGRWPGQKQLAPSQPHPELSLDADAEAAFPLMVSQSQGKRRFMISNNPQPWCSFLLSLIRQVSLGAQPRIQDSFAAITAECSHITRYWELRCSLRLFLTSPPDHQKCPASFSYIKILLLSAFSSLNLHGFLWIYMVFSVTMQLSSNPVHERMWP